MAYEKGNRELTDEQFSEGTTIDGSRIDKAIEDIIDHQNDIPIGDMEAKWMPTTYVMAWAPSRPRFRMYPNDLNMANTNRFTPDNLYGTQQHYFPFLACHNHPDEVYPVAEQPTKFNNEWRQKGFFHSSNIDLEFETQSRSSNIITPTYAPSDIAAGNNPLPTRTTRQAGPVTTGNIYSALHRKHFAATFPFYFSNPVVLMGVSVFAAQEHPVSFYNSANIGAGALFYRVQSDGYKNQLLTAVQYDYTSQQCTVQANSIEASTGGNLDPNSATYLSAKTGTEYPGEKWTTRSETAVQDGENFGQGTISLSIDNTFLTERRDLNNILFHKFDMGSEAQRFNRVHNTNSTAGHSRPESGAQYTDMTPEYAGGATWGVWAREDNLNIPIPRDSRVRLSVIPTGFRSTQLFEWHIAITVLELVKK
jgi:hypothetical protein